MAKRFTDTDKWKKKFIRGLQAPYKLLWLYILDECDHAGVWIVDFEVAQLRLGENLNEDDALNFFEEKIFKIDGGEKWLILDFIDFQYGVLNDTNKAHQAVIKNLIKYDLWHKEEKQIKKIKPLPSPLQGAKEKEKEKDKEKEEEKEKGRIEILEHIESEIELEFTPTFEDFWNEYDKKVGEKSKVKAKWEKLRQREKETIMEYIPNYKISQPEKRYRKNPDTFLNNKSWNDEIIYGKQTTKNDKPTFADTRRGYDNSSFNLSGQKDFN